MTRLEKHLRLFIVGVGTLGILALTFNDAYFVNPDKPLASLRIFKYFTIQSNLVAVIYFWILYSLRVDLKSEKWKNLIGGVMIYTTITFLVFAIVLEPLWEESGLELLGSICLHYINPLLIIGYVGYYRKEFSFKLKDSLTWIIYPSFYLVFLTILGLITGDFLYPFFQISVIGVLGYIGVIIGLVGLFFLLSFLLVKILSKK